MRELKIIVLTGITNNHCMIVGRNTVSDQIVSSGIRASGFQEKEIYHPADRPGYTAWVSLWPGASGEWFISYYEKKRAVNPVYRTIPLEGWMAMGFAYRMQTAFVGGSPDILSEMVVMRTGDRGDSWQEVGRSATDLYAFFGYLSLPNGDILRGYTNSFLCFYEDDVPTCGIQRSSDMGNTWVEHSVLMTGYYTYVYRLRRLNDGALVALGRYCPAFGPGRAKQGRNNVLPHTRTELVPVMWVSYDEGRTWSSPIGVFQNCTDVWEPDIVELPTGDLLLLNSRVQGGPAVRQICRRRGNTFIPEIVFDVVSGTVPETVALTKDGLLVGTVRGGAYTSSNDNGATWHAVDGLPTTGHHYQPMIACLDDGRLLCVWHYGCDSAFGDFDELIGQHRFMLEGSLPDVSHLELRREMNTDGTQFINAYSARLTANDNPLANREVEFSLTAHSNILGKTSYAITDSNGIARAAFPEWDSEIDVHVADGIVASFSPKEGDNVSGCKSDTIYAYRMSPRKGCPHAYGFYVSRDILYVRPDILDEYPDLPLVIGKLASTRDFTLENAVSQTSLSVDDILPILSCLQEHHVIHRRADGRWVWSSLGAPIGRLRKMEIEDSFI